jgi:hypothetical protein
MAELSAMNIHEPFAHIDPQKAGDTARQTALLTLDLLIGAEKSAREAGRFREAGEAATSMARGVTAIAAHLASGCERDR